MESKNYLDYVRTDTYAEKNCLPPIVFEDSNIERCQIIDYVKGWDGKGCTDPKHKEELNRSYGVTGEGYTRVMYRCHKHGVVSDNLYFGSQEERTGMCKCYECITDEILRVDCERYKRSENERLAKMKELEELKKQRGKR